MNPDHSPCLPNESSLSLTSPVEDLAKAVIQLLLGTLKDRFSLAVVEVLDELDDSSDSAEEDEDEPSEDEEESFIESSALPSFPKP